MSKMSPSLTASWHTQASCLAQGGHLLGENTVLIPQTNREGLLNTM